MKLPQEFIPSGRQLVARHPGLPKSGRDKSIEQCALDALVVKRLEQVSLSEETPLEWWIVRESPDFYDQNRKVKHKIDEEEYMDRRENKTNLFSNDSWSWKTIDPNVSAKTPGRQSDFYKIGNRSTFSGDSDVFSRNDSRMSSKSSKRLSVTNNAIFKPGEVKKKSDLPTMEEELYVKGALILI